MSDGIGARIFQTPRQDEARADFWFLDRARDRHHGGLDVVCRSKLGQSSQELRRISPNRSASVYRHDRMGHVLESGTQIFPQRNRGAASEKENPMGTTGK